ncbi:MAG: hypothetical protein WAV32_00615 [Halobacteriota archaeon]
MNSRSLIALVLIITIIIINLLAFATPAAGSDALKRDLLQNIISLNKSGVFDDYDELSLAKAEVQAVIQSMEGSEVTYTTKEWVNIFLTIVDKFEKMAPLSESQSPADHKEALKMADSINTSIIKLNSYATAERNGIPMLAERALKRFYRDEGRYFKDMATNTNVTKVKIEYEYISSASYGEGGMPSDASRMKFEALRDERMYKRDMERASEYVMASRSYLDNARSASSSLFGAAFMEIIKARDSYEHAEKLYEKHRDNALGDIKGLKPEINRVYQRLMLDTLIVVAIYLLILTCITVILWLDFNRWTKELDDTRLGEEVIV